MGPSTEREMWENAQTLLAEKKDPSHYTQVGQGPAVLCCEHTVYHVYL